jgi:hypothetical protein
MASVFFVFLRLDCFLAMAKHFEVSGRKVQAWQKNLAPKIRRGKTKVLGLYLALGP